MGLEQRILDRRKGERSRAAIDAACTLGGVSYPVRLINVSAGGCCAALRRGHAVPGDKVMVLLGPLVALPATVRWVHDGMAGLEFAAPLHGAVLTHYGLRSRCGPETRH